LPRLPDPELEQRILDAASRLWARGGEKSLTMRAVAKAAGTTTPTVYERYRDRDDILTALRQQTRSELFAVLHRTRSLREIIRRQIEFALEHPNAYVVLFDGIAKSPSVHETWPTFNLLRERLAKRLGGTPRQHNRLMLALWSQMHGTSMLIIRGGFEGALRTQAVYACIDAIETILDAAQSRRIVHSGPQWPASLILGEGRSSRVDAESNHEMHRAKPGKHR